MVAAASHHDVRAFRIANGFEIGEVRRVHPRIQQPVDFPANKVLIKLPGWSSDPDTVAWVNCWVFVEDRFTFEIEPLEEPEEHEWEEHHRRGVLSRVHFVIACMCALVFGWTMITTVPLFLSLGWLLAAGGFIFASLATEA